MRPLATSSASVARPVTHVPRRAVARMWGLLVSALVTVLPLAACTSDSQLHWQEDPEGHTGPVLAAAVDGDSTFIGRQETTSEGRFVIVLVHGEARRTVPMLNGTAGYASTAELHSLAVKDGVVLALGGVRAGAHSNVRWVVWQGTAEGLTEQPQPFETFGGWGAGDLVGAAMGDRGPLIVGSWANPTGRGMDVTTWTPTGTRWLRSTDTVVAAATQTSLPSPLAATADGSQYVIAGSITHLGERIWRGPALWYADEPHGPWHQLELPLPDHAADGEAAAVACSAGHCAVAGWAGQDAVYWPVSFDAANALPPSGATILHGKARAEDSRNSQVAVVTTPAFDLVATSDGLITHTMSVESGRLTSTSDVPGSLRALFAPPHSAPELVTQAERSRTWRLIAPTSSRSPTGSERATQ